MYYIYILRSEKVDKFYVGITDNPNQRLLEHNNSERSTFTAKYRPWIMEALFECSEQLGNARRVERYIKR